MNNPSVGHVTPETDSENGKNIYAYDIKDEFPLGKKIFETYPAGSLKLLNLPFKKYKNQQTRFKNGHWTIENGEKLAKIANCLKLTSEEEITLNDDELDAIICAITGVVDEEYLLLGVELTKRMQDLKGTENFGRICAPAGYVLLKSLPDIKMNLRNIICKKKMLPEVARRRSRKK